MLLLKLNTISTFVVKTFSLVITRELYRELYSMHSNTTSSILAPGVLDEKNLPPKNKKTKKNKTGKSGRNRSNCTSCCKYSRPLGGDKQQINRNP